MLAVVAERVGAVGRPARGGGESALEHEKELALWAWGSVLRSGDKGKAGAHAEAVEDVELRGVAVSAGPWRWQRRTYLGPGLLFLGLRDDGSRTDLAHAG